MPIMPEYMDAYEIFRRWKKRGDALFSGQYPARSYYAMLRKAMYEELLQGGQCALIDQCLEADASSKYDIVLITSMTDAMDAVLQEVELRPVDPERFVVGNFDRTWRNLQKPLANLPMVNIDEAGKEQLKVQYGEIRNRFCAKEEPQMQAEETPVTFGEDPIAEAVLHVAQKKAQMIVQDAEAKRDVLLKEAEKQLAEAIRQRELVMEEAKQQGLLVIEETARQRSLVLKEAEQQAEAILLQAQTAAEDYLAECRRKAEEQAEQEAKRLVTEKMAVYMQQQRSQWENERQEDAAERNRVQDAVVALKAEACDVTNGVGAELNQTLESALNTLSELRSGLMSGLQQWRSSLYKMEFGPLVNFYMNLTAVASRFERDALGEAQAPLTPEAELTKLQSHSSGMNMLQKNLIRAMEGMGIRLYQPAAGEVFHSYYHAAAGVENEEACNGCTITECVAPGLLRNVNGQEAAVLHRATVKVELPDE